MVNIRNFIIKSSIGITTFVPKEETLNSPEKSVFSISLLVLFIVIIITFILYHKYYR